MSNFQVGLMDDLKAWEPFTQNMVAMLILKYNPDRRQSFKLNPFLEDLTHIETLNRTTIRIFKSQRQVDEFNLMETHQAQQFNLMHSKLVDPLPEPIFVVRSAKNTYYDISWYERNQKPEQFRLANSWSFKLDELVRRTRQRGFTIEGFFQIFGKFSHYDGIRKLNVS